MAYTLSMKINQRTAAMSMAYLVAITLLTGCKAQQGLNSLQLRRVDVPVATGADESLDDRFGLTADAQDPHQRDEEMGYGRWKSKPDPEGTSPPTSPSRRSSWTGSP